MYWDQLHNFRPTPTCSCGKCTCNISQKIENLQFQDLVTQFLMGLNDLYSQIKGQILLMDPLPSINKVYSLLIQEERQRNVGNNSNVHIESIALVVKGFDSAALNPNSSFNYSRGSGFLRGKNSRGKDRPICTYYGKLGHIMEKCLQLHGFRSSLKERLPW